MKAGVAREALDGERRVAATPETVKQLTGLGLAVEIESGAGLAAGHSDSDYRHAGASVVQGLDLGTL
ncbi:NAD(P)(+) transhydrogenase (Re/Si-specific) subunit alpha, partial [Paraburkholderia sp. SIMBA_030]